jgi:hypothetical protein
VAAWRRRKGSANEPGMRLVRRFIREGGPTSRSGENCVSVHSGVFRGGEERADLGMLKEQ